ncbi:hypothetical protein [Ramlibacter albus]|uniref:Uncharacterized protein n=1 Tax=Ramlibacter albus TaxID=2079448 RepID=A0A923S164_9BURK|nr:hypothetical protein [Ramlibacter albus]MBC5763328.1 hypothetical protein [Ramlibacter albus]
MKTWTYFREGFVGSFELAAAIVMAVVRVAADFLNGGAGPRDRHRSASHS